MSADPLDDPAAAFRRRRAETPCDDWLDVTRTATDPTVTDLPETDDDRTATARVDVFPASAWNSADPEPTATGTATAELRTPFK